MIERSKWFGRVAWAISLIVAAGLNGVATYAQNTSADATGQQLADVSKNAWDMASGGKLDDVWQQIKQLSEAAPASNPALVSLSKDIDLHEAHEQTRAQRTLAEYQKKVAKLHEQVDQKKLREALISAVQAYSLVDDPKTLMDDPKVQELIKLAEAEAAEHQKNSEWLKALSLYRGLELLFENSAKYTDQIKRVGAHVAMLRLYAPEVLFELYKKEAAENHEDAPEPWNFDEDRWEKKLKGITLSMLTEGLALGAHRHVEQDTSYEDLIIGGIDQLKVMFDTKGLEKTFPTLADAGKVSAFVDYLDTLRISLARREGPMGRAEASNILDRLVQRNVATVDLPQAVVVHELGDGAMNRLDEFSVYIWPYQVERFERTTKGKFSGVGIQITLVDRQLTVVTPLEDTPAFKARIKAGDQIVTIDGKSTVGMDLESAVDKITGPEDTQVTLGVKSPGDEKAREVTLTRSSIHIVTVKGWQRTPSGGWDYYIDPALKIGYVRMTQFGPDTADELDAAVQQMVGDKGLNGLIFDLRFDPGGRLDAAVAVANRFLTKGVIVSTTQQLLTGQPWSASADPLHTYADFPVIILVNKGSASAAEIVSGCLKDHKRALIVGQRSYGKGSVQNLFRLGDDQAYLKLTTQYYRLPNGEIIHRRPGADKWGIEPDVNVKMTDEQVADVLEARLVLDVLHDGDDKNFDPNAIINKPKPKEGEAVEEKPQDKLPPIKTADEILTRGLDPQLETAVLLLKTRLLGEPRS
ncbi:MAG: PDZ domain-containing protein [Planctomycetes bacterium]|nr:PDZ domain-containing protein [Planctomycetota bacterium]